MQILPAGGDFHKATPSAAEELSFPALKSLTAQKSTTFVLKNGHPALTSAFLNARLEPIDREIL
jgi:hypothetical protein